MAYELYSHMLKHIYWGSYTIAVYFNIRTAEERIACKVLSICIKHEQKGEAKTKRSVQEGGKNTGR